MHYRTGKRYKIIGIGRDTELMQEVVMYEAQYADAEFPFAQLWCRPLTMFMGKVAHSSELVERFKKNPRLSGFHDN